VVGGGVCVAGNAAIVRYVSQPVVVVAPLEAVGSTQRHIGRRRCVHAIELGRGGNALQEKARARLLTVVRRYGEVLPSRPEYDGTTGMPPVICQPAGAMRSKRNLTDNRRYKMSVCEETFTRKARTNVSAAEERCAVSASAIARGCGPPAARREFWRRHWADSRARQMLAAQVSMSCAGMRASAQQQTRAALWRPEWRLQVISVAFRRHPLR